MKYIKKDGSTVEAFQECQCLTHVGPHWLHMDYLRNVMNAENILGWKENKEPILTYMKVLAFMKEESMRLRDKTQVMKALGIEGILYETEEEKKEEERKELKNIEVLLQELERIEKNILEKDGKTYIRKEKK